MPVLCIAHLRAVLFIGCLGSCRNPSRRRSRAERERRQRRRKSRAQTPGVIKKRILAAFGLCVYQEAVVAQIAHRLWMEVGGGGLAGKARGAGGESKGMGRTGKDGVDGRPHAQAAKRQQLEEAPAKLPQVEAVCAQTAQRGAMNGRAGVRCRLLVARGQPGPSAVPEPKGRRPRPAVVPVAFPTFLKVARPCTIVLGKVSL